VEISRKHQQRLRGIGQMMAVGHFHPTQQQSVEPVHLDNFFDLGYDWIAEHVGQDLNGNLHSKEVLEFEVIQVAVLQGNEGLPDRHEPLDR
jgi:hypothetical protein